MEIAKMKFQDITLLAALRHIKLKADIMVMDAPSNSVFEQDAKELQLLAGIALRRLEEGK
jgi:ABC-type sugar transport system ATPase subunit